MQQNLFYLDILMHRNLISFCKTQLSGSQNTIQSRRSPSNTEPRNTSYGSETETPTVSCGEFLINSKLFSPQSIFTLYLYLYVGSVLYKSFLTLPKFTGTRPFTWLIITFLGLNVAVLNLNQGLSLLMLNFLKYSSLNHCKVCTYYKKICIMFQHLN